MFPASPAQRGFQIDFAAAFQNGGYAALPGMRRDAETTISSYAGRSRST